jgi:hypothetical protein
MHNTREGYYVALTTKEPFALVLTKQRFDGAGIVGASFQSERALKPVVDQMKAKLMKEFRRQFGAAPIIGAVRGCSRGRGERGKSRG